MTDLTRKKDFSQKKTLSVAAARVTHDMVAGTTVQKLFNLPANAVIVDAMIVVEVQGQGSLTVDFGYTGAADVLYNNAALDGNDGDVLSEPHDISGLTLTEGTPNVYLAGGAVKNPRIWTGTGKEVIATFSADPTAGSFVFIVTYIEYDLANGQLMNLSDGT